MMEQDPLSQLRDIHLPDPAGFWPPAPGWWVLLVLLLVLAAAVAILASRKVRRNRWIALALTELDQLEQQPSRDNHWFTQLNQLLKRSARVRYPERRPESMSGAEWVDFLLETSPHDRIASRPVIEAMVASSWHPHPTCAPGEALRVSRVWLKGQRC